MMLEEILSSIGIKNMIVNTKRISVRSYLNM